MSDLRGQSGYLLLENAEDFMAGGGLEGVWRVGVLEDLIL